MEQFDFLLAELRQVKTQKNFGIKGWNMEDYLMWTFMILQHNYRYEKLAIKSLPRLKKSQIRRKFVWVLHHLRARLGPRFIRFRSFDEHLQASQDVLRGGEQMGDFMDSSGFIIDGTGSETYTPTDAKIGRKTWCYFKHKSMFRWQVIIDFSGYVVYVSKRHEGAIGDDGAMARDADLGGFVDAFCDAFPNIIGDRRKPIKRVGTGRFFIFADKGYGKWVPPPLTELWLTASATENNPRGGRYVSKDLYGKCIFCDARIATYRQRVERLFGVQWKECVYLQQKHYVSEADVVYNATIVLFCLRNRRILDGEVVL